MIPKFSSPCILQISTKVVSRADLKSSDLGEDTRIDTTDADVPTLTKRLRELVQNDIGDFAFPLKEQQPSKKRRKLEDGAKDVTHETAICASVLSCVLCSYV